MDAISRLRFADLCKSLKEVSEARSRVWDGHRIDSEVSDTLCRIDDNLMYVIDHISIEMRSRL